jgi:FkbM family methyltransferase
MTEIMTRDVALNKISSDIGELEGILESVVANDTGILDALSQMLSAMHQMQRKNEQLQKRLTDELSALTEAVQQLDLKARSLQKAIVVDGDPSAHENPEDGLLEFLFAFLPNTTAIDIGANVGRVSERLLATGYTVYAFEPYAPSFQKLTQRLSGQKNFHAFEYAIGSGDSTMNLNVAADTSGENKWDPTLFNSLTDHAMLEDCKFTSTLPVKVRSLESLQRAGEIPESAGLLKIDTEGFDLNVIRGMGNGKFSVVMTEYWDPAHPFGVSGHGRLEDLVTEMKARGFAWYIVIYHVDETSTISYYSNRLRTVPKSWGNVLFFSDHATFTHAIRWCGEVLPPTLYR